MLKLHPLMWHFLTEVAFVAREEHDHNFMTHGTQPPPAKLRCGNYEEHIPQILSRRWVGGESFLHWLFVAGAGKSSLLNVLAGRLRSHDDKKVTGELLANGYPMNQRGRHFSPSESVWNMALQWISDTAADVCFHCLQPCDGEAHTQRSDGPFFHRRINVWTTKCILVELSEANTLFLRLKCGEWECYIFPVEYICPACDSQDSQKAVLWDFFFATNRNTFAIIVHAVFCRPWLRNIKTTYKNRRIVIIARFKDTLAFIDGTQTVTM